MPKLREGFGIYFDPTKTTSGQRFFGILRDALSSRARPLSDNPRVVLFNISGRIQEIVKSKLRRQKVAIRVDGLYFDRLSPAFVATFPRSLRWLFLLGLRIPLLHDPLAHLANLIDQNYKAFIRIALADLVIYQSEFSRKIHAVYFPLKPNRVIVNGSVYEGGRFSAEGGGGGTMIRLVTIYNDWRPGKRLHELVEFVRWARDEKGIPVSLAILGYTGKLPRCAPESMREILESHPCFRTFPKFSDIAGGIKEALLEGDMYITFTNRDSCPNVVIEAMAHGLPVVGLRSGGLPDIVEDAGILLPDSDTGGFFASGRHDSDFPPIDRDAVLGAVLDVKARIGEFRARVRRRFDDDLGIDVVAERYISALEAVK